MVALSSRCVVSSCHCCGMVIICCGCGCSQSSLWLVVAADMVFLHHLDGVLACPGSCWWWAGGLISAPLIPAGIRWNKIWQEGLLFFFIPVPFIPAEFGHSGIETGMFRGICRNGMQWNPVVCLFVCLFHTCYQTNHQPNTV